MNAIGPGAIDDVVQNVATQIGVINPLHGATLDRQTCTDIMDQISNHVVVAGAVIPVVNSGTAVASAGSRNIVNVIAHDSDKRPQVENSQPDIASNIEALNVNVVATILPRRIRSWSDYFRPPACIRPEGDPRSRIAAG